MPTRIRLAALSLLVFSRLVLAGPEPAGAFFAIICRDVETSVDWYRSTLQLEPVNRMTEAGEYDIVILQKPGLMLELMQLQAAAARPEGYLHGPFKVGFFVDDLDKFVDSLPPSIPEPEVIADTEHHLELLQLRDPDDNIVQIMEIVEDGRH